MPSELTCSAGCGVWSGGETQNLEASNGFNMIYIDMIIYVHVCLNTYKHFKIYVWADIEHLCITLYLSVLIDKLSIYKIE